MRVAIASSRTGAEMVKKQKLAKQFLIAAELSDKDLQKAIKNEIAEIHPIDAITELVARNSPQFPALLRERLTSAVDDEVRASSAAALSAKNTAANRNALLAALKDKAPEVVRRAAQSLGRIGGAAELEALRKLRPKQPVVKRAMITAKTLLSYRLGEKRGLLNTPKENVLLHLGTSKFLPIDVKALSLKKLGLAEQLARDLPEIRLSDQTLKIDCDRWNYLVVFNREVFSRNAAALFKKSSLFGILLRNEQIDDRYNRYAYLLTHPGTGNKLQTFAMRESAEIAYYGQILQAEDGLEFDIKALSSRHTRPIEFSGIINPKNQTISGIHALMGIEKDPKQPAQKQPRQIRFAIK